MRYVLAGVTKDTIPMPKDLVDRYRLEQHSIKHPNIEHVLTNSSSTNNSSNTWCIVGYPPSQQNAKTAALYHHEIVNNLCHALPFLPSRWLPTGLPTASSQQESQPQNVHDLARRWHVAYALEFVIYQPPPTSLSTSTNYLRDKAAHNRHVYLQHQQFISQLPVQASYWQQRPDGAYSGSFLVSKWHVKTFAQRFDKQFAKLGYKRFGAWAPYSFVNPPADR